MIEKLSLAVTPEEARELLIRRVERALLDSGISLTAAERKRLADAMPVRPADSRPESRTSAPATDADIVARVKSRALKQSGNRARVYKPTSRAHEVEHAESTSDKVISLIVRSKLCTAEDLEKETKRPRKAIYTALWHLKREGLIETIPVSEL